ncbi:MAG: FxsA family protein, partial [Desulfohalobiaceae bacterium]
MLLKLFLAFTLIPIAEIYVLIKLGGVFGALNTILLVLLTALAGAYLAKLQGLKTMLQIRHNLD